MATAAPAGQCCGVPAAVPGATPSAAMWDAQMEWYVENLSPYTAILAHELHNQVGLFAPAAGCQLKVLETHCADARAAARLLPLQAVGSYTACDFSPAMVEKARGALQGRADVALADSTDLPFGDAAFDCYISNMGCCCVSDLDAKLREARRVLAPGGRIAISMRIGDFEGDTTFTSVQQVLEPLGLPPGPDREGLRLGKDLPRLRAKLQEAGFQEPRAWRTWITIPIGTASDSFVTWASKFGHVPKFLASLDDAKRQQALDALREASKGPLEQGSLQLAVAVVAASVA